MTRTSLVSIGPFLVVALLWIGLYPSFGYAQTPIAVTSVDEMSLVDANGRLLSRAVGGNFYFKGGWLQVGPKVVGVQLSDDLTDWDPGSSYFTSPGCQGQPYFGFDNGIPVAPFAPGIIRGALNTLFVPAEVPATLVTMYSLLPGSHGCGDYPKGHTILAVPAVPAIDLDRVYRLPFHYVVGGVGAHGDPSTSTPIPVAGSASPGMRVPSATGTTAR